MMTSLDPKRLQSGDHFTRNMRLPIGGQL